MNVERSHPAGSKKDGEGLFILTGAPGAGKTPILDDLGPDVRGVGEPAREVLKEQRSAGGAVVAEYDPSSFVELLLQRSIEKNQMALRSEGPVVFDRGVPDCIAYATYLGRDPEPSVLAAQAYRYQRQVLILAPWEEIYTVDHERTMSFADTVEFHGALVGAYQGAGYTLVEVPRGSVEDRVAFVRNPARLSGRIER